VQSALADLVQLHFSISFQLPTCGLTFCENMSIHIPYKHKFLCHEISRLSKHQINTDRQTTRQLKTQHPLHYLAHSANHNQPQIIIVP